jgi:hypothetical protein
VQPSRVEGPRQRQRRLEIASRRESTDLSLELLFTPRCRTIGGGRGVLHDAGEQQAEAQPLFTSGHIAHGGLPLGGRAARRTGSS